jgi:hypothetical protein
MNWFLELSLKTWEIDELTRESLDRRESSTFKYWELRRKFYGIRCWSERKESDSDLKWLLRNFFECGTMTELTSGEANKDLWQWGLVQDASECPNETKSLKSYMKRKISEEYAIRDISVLIGNSQHLADDDKVLPSSFPWIIPQPRKLAPVAGETSIRTVSMIFPRWAKITDSHLIHLPWCSPQRKRAFAE